MSNSEKKAFLTFPVPVVVLLAPLILDRKMYDLSGDWNLECSMLGLEVHTYNDIEADEGCSVDLHSVMENLV